MGKNIHTKLSLALVILITSISLLNAFELCREAIIYDLNLKADLSCINIHSSLYESVVVSYDDVTMCHPDDSEAPTIVPNHSLIIGTQHNDNLYVDCDNLPQFNSDHVLVSDDYDNSPLVLFSEELISHGNCFTDDFLYHMVCGWYATDNCGKTTTFLLNIYVIDNNAPMIFGVPDDQTLQCRSEVQEPTLVGSMDMCDLNSQINFTESSSNNSDCFSTITRTWIATDHCGNTTTQSQIITIEDTTPPMAQSMPMDFTINCGDQMPFVPNIEAIDNCDQEIEVNFEQTTMFEEPCSSHYLRTWTLIDDCNNQTTISQNIYIIDNQNPTFDNIPADLTINCNATPPEVPNNISVSDNCDPNVFFTFEETESGTICNSRHLVRLWTATDACGNTTFATQTIMMADTQAPVFTGLPSDLLLQCDEPIPAAPQLQVTDDCDQDIEVSFDQVILSDDCSQMTIERTWTAIDDCGRESSETQTINIVDTQAPIFSELVADIQISCNAPVPGIPDLTAFDNCTSDIDLVITEEEYEIPGCSNPGIIRTWSATDGCGNERIQTQNISRNADCNLNISFVNPELANHIHNDHIYVECQTDPLTIDDAVASNCNGQVQLSFEELIVSVDNCEIILSCSWYAQDEFDEEVTLTLYVQIVDSQGPIFDQSILPDLQANCDNIPEPMTLTAEDLCHDLDQITVEDQLINPNSCQDLFILRTWTATDECGNASTLTQTIFLNDNTNPVFLDTPVDITIGCFEEVPPIEILNATDDCDNDVFVTYSQTFIEGDMCSGNNSIIRTWFATDDCGNQSSISQNIIIVDNMQPIWLGAPEDTVASCDSIPLAPVIGQDIKAVDACDPNVDIEFSETFEGVDCSNLVLIRRWVATDDCGNSIIHTQNIQLVDNQNPIFASFPPNQQFDCVDDIPEPIFPTVTDNCDPDIQVYMLEGEVTIGCTYVLTRQFVATDLCGNETSSMQTITVIDNEAPQFSLIPSSVLLQCGDPLPPMPQITASDNCNGVVDVVTSQDEQSNADCPGESIITRTFSAIDNCGNSSLLSYSITFVDDQAPNFVISNNNPLNISNQGITYLECQDISNLQELILVEDNCDNDPNVIFEEDLIQFDDCNQDGALLQLNCMWTATDQCNNVSQFSTTLIIRDQTAPQIQCPADLTVDLNQDESIPDNNPPSVFDNCTNEIVMTPDEFTINMPNGCGYIITRIWTATDECGNSSECTYQITVLGACECPEEGNIDFNVISTDCDQSNGTFELFIDVPTSFNYQYLPNYGISNEVGNIRTGMPSGDYILTITSDYMPDCIAKVYFTISDNCTDELNVEPPNANDDNVQAQAHQTIIFDVCLNDELRQGTINDIQLLTSTNNGVAFLQNDMVHFVPTDFTCEEVQIEYQVCNDMGCDQAILYINYECPDLIVRSGFSPNGDGINDQLTIAGAENRQDNQLMIFNRWGKIVYHTKGYKNDWRGTMNGKDLPDGSYFYIFYPTTNKNNPMTGYISLQR